MSSNVSRAASKFGEMVGITGAPVFTKDENVIDLIIEDHKQAKIMYEDYKKVENLESKKSIFRNLIKALVQHDETEQLLLYPLLREKVGSEEHYDRSLKEHQEHREMLYDLMNKSNITDADFDEKLKKAMDTIDHHVKQEESEVLLLVKEKVSEDDLKRVGASFKAHKLVSAQRPHPSAPTQGYPAALANVILKPFDMAKDIWESM